MVKNLKEQRIVLSSKDDVWWVGSKTKFTPLAFANAFHIIRKQYKISKQRNYHHLTHGGKKKEFKIFFFAFK